MVQCRTCGHWQRIRRVIGEIFVACAMCLAPLFGEDPDAAVRYRVDPALTQPIGVVASVASTSQASLPTVGSVRIVLPDEF